ncbi:DUF3999 family protein [Caenimonas aquaedulcis]|uniref:DUF3999 family protein n=1 Tax=Caenimonas aquaedulcis TaxID=2793270 RepID=A0A931MGK8_9BURK|nr:DUF3999 family protein [Caenimonas aquaedulcis]MBG9388291.1 DUF3999 family protein [Caenimonas aquaedulcis]
MKRLSLALAWGVAMCGAPAASAQAPQAREFAWRAPVTLPAGASMARIDLPVDALARLQSRDARDVRVFNAAGEAVPFAFAGAPAHVTAPPSTTQAFPAMPLFSTSARQSRPVGGAIQVQIGDGQRSVWVRTDGQAPAPGAARVDSVIFDTRGLKEPLAALQVQATLPPNTPVRLEVSSSSDLARWDSAGARGRLYRFEGAGAPANDTLQLDAPLVLEGRYLRLDWDGQEGVAVSSVTGTTGSTLRPRARLRTALPALQPQAQGLEVRVPFATPIATLSLATNQANSLQPVRILGRNEPSQPWRVLASTVIFRLGSAGNETTNEPLPLHGAPVAWLRIESTQGAALAPGAITAAAEFEPLRVVFVATGDAPFQLAAGRAATPPAALPLSTLSAALAGKRIDDLPQAVTAAAVTGGDAQPEPGFLASLRPAGMTERSAVLWAVLVAGVLVLGAVAWSLMRQLKSAPPPAE